MASEMTGSVSPMRLAHPDVAPSLSRSKRGLSIDGIPSSGGPPDLTSSNGTVWREKSVRGHSARQLPGSAMALPPAVAMTGATSVAATSNVTGMRFRNLNGSPLRCLIPLSASRSRSFDVYDSLDRPKRLPAGCECCVNIAAAKHDLRHDYLRTHLAKLERDRAIGANGIGHKVSQNDLEPIDRH